MVAKVKRCKRQRSFFFYEREVRDLGYNLIAGVDEVGRGPLAGPVVSAAAVLPPDFCYRGMDDSKKLSAPQREQIFQRLLEDDRVSYAAGIVDNRRIDKINILRATIESMWLALAHLEERPDFVLVDGFDIPQMRIPQRSLIKGDSRSASIAAASIVAKVTRDRIMTKYHEQYPQYGFDRHKGYCTAHHLAMLRRHGACPIHRKSFAPCRQQQKELDL